MPLPPRSPGFVGLHNLYGNLCDLEDKRERDQKDNEIAILKKQVKKLKKKLDKLSK